MKLLVFVLLFCAAVGIKPPRFKPTAILQRGEPYIMKAIQDVRSRGKVPITHPETGRTIQLLQDDCDGGDGDGGDGVDGGGDGPDPIIDDGCQAASDALELASFSILFTIFVVEEANWDNELFASACTNQAIAAFDNAFDDVEEHCTGADAWVAEEAIGAKVMINGMICLQADDEFCFFELMDVFGGDEGECNDDEDDDMSLAEVQELYCGNECLAAFFEEAVAHDECAATASIPILEVMCMEIDGINCYEEFVEGLSGVDIEGNPISDDEQVESIDDLCKTRCHIKLINTIQTMHDAFEELECDEDGADEDAGFGDDFDFEQLCVADPTENPPRYCLTIVAEFEDDEEPCPEMDNLDDNPDCSDDCKTFAEDLEEEWKCCVGWFMDMNDDNDHTEDMIEFLENECGVTVPDACDEVEDDEPDTVFEVELSVFITNLDCEWTKDEVEDGDVVEVFIADLAKDLGIFHGDLEFDDVDCADDGTGTIIKLTFTTHDEDLANTIKNDVGSLNGEDVLLLLNSKLGDDAKIDEDEDFAVDEARSSASVTEVEDNADATENGAERVLVGIISALGLGAAVAL